MNLTHKLLDHPFYQAWSHGKVTQDQLARYARGYAEFIGLMPAYWARIGQGLNVDTSKLVAEETAHAVLWEKWAAKLPEPSTHPRMTAVIEALDKLSPSELLGAVQAFEVQQPEVARTKKDGLLAHYGFAEKDTVYFDEHLKEEAHIEFGSRVAAAKAKPQEYQHGFELGAKWIYHSLDSFVA